MTPKHDFFIYHSINAMIVSAVMMVAGSIVAFFTGMGFGTALPLLWLFVPALWVAGARTSVMWDSFVRERLQNDARDWINYRELPKAVKKQISITPRSFFALSGYDRQTIVSKLGTLNEEYRQHEREANKPQITALVERIDSQISDYREHNRTLRELG